jgi:hypothetical protein
MAGKKGPAVNSAEAQAPAGAGTAGAEAPADPAPATQAAPESGAGASGAAIPELDIQGITPASEVGSACSVLDPDCEACQ